LPSCGDWPSGPDHVAHRTAAAAVPRLLDLKIEGFLLRSTRGGGAQRLVRRCAIAAWLRSGPADLAADPRYALLGLEVGETVHDPVGCERCGGTGYRGRNGVFEVLDTNEEVRSLIGAHADAVAIDEAAMRAGMTTMIDDGLAKCRAGLTSPAEILRVTTLR
jgi:general secretion pathway protein E